MVRERKTKVAERVISLLLAAVMAVSGTGFTALAADIVPDETVSEVETVIVRTTPIRTMKLF